MFRWNSITNPYLLVTLHKDTSLQCLILVHLIFSKIGKGDFCHPFYVFVNAGS